MKIKICGITNLADAQAAVAAGADYLGFIFYQKSPRSVTLKKAVEIIIKLKTPVKKVGVFVNASSAEINNTAFLCGLDIIQLHGDEPAALAEQLGSERVWKAFHITSEEDIARAAKYPAAAIVVDTATAGLRGGTGKPCDWQLAAQAAQSFTTILAGGINPQNVQEAIETVKPFAIDTASGVEASPGIKDHKKIEELFEVLGVRC
ncbi:MAG: phosphoribosylanthranilate isomerase [Victivallaceae bacterium]|nr:phosphoribosylanthranilate isomerase [Victivallaceae bacterium]